MTPSNATDAPNREKDRNARELPNDEKSITDKVEPKRAKLRRENELPSMR
jgi:hypothetical protein